MPLPDGVDAWLTVPDAAELLGVSVTDVRQLLREGRLIALRGEPGEPLRIPAGFVQRGPVALEVTKGLPAVITLLRDGGYDDEAVVRWLHTADDSLPGTPVAALLCDRGTEVKRRAQASAF